MQLLHLLLSLGHLKLRALASVVYALQARPVLPERGLHLQLLLNGRVRQLRPVPLHLGRAAEGALQTARLALHLLQLALETVKLRLALHIGHVHD